MTKRMILAALLIATTACGGGNDSKADSVIMPKLPTTPWKDREFTNGRGADADLSVIQANTAPRTTELKRRLRERDQAAVRCMAKHGEKIELDYKGAAAPLASNAEPGAKPMTNAEAAKRFGFGIAATWREDGTQDPTFESAVSASTSGSGVFNANDPEAMLKNGALPGVPVKYPAGGSGGPAFERIAAMVGTDARDNDGATAGNGSQTYGPPTTLPPGMKQNCTEQANDETGFGPNKSPMRGYAVNSAKLASLAKSAIESDKEIRAAQHKYSACMVSHGYEGVSEPVAARGSIVDAFRPILDAQMAAQSGGQSSDGAPLSPDLAARGKAIAVREVAMATANLDCETEFRKVAEPRSFEVQKRVLRENQALVNSLRNPK